MDRPDIVARVFQLKKTHIIQVLRAGLFFPGMAVYILHVIEFQKRGLPHTHIAVRLAGRQPSSPESIDAIVCAEMPRIEQCPNHAIIAARSTCDCNLHRLHRTVSTQLLHACRPSTCHKPARPGHPASTPCKRGYPKDLHIETSIHDRGCVIYRRREERDRTVVPYSAALCLAYNAHINVEIAHTIKIIKYLHKYIRKGRDKMAVAVLAEGAVVDELTEYQQSRYVSASEAIYRVLEYDLNCSEPGVTRLQVQL